MHISQDLALVLKKTIYQDSKIMVNAFTKNYGLISFSVTLNKRLSHRLGCFEIGNLINLDLNKTRHGYKFHDARVIFSPLALRKSLDLLCLWAKFLDTLHRLLPAHVPNPLFFEFLKKGLTVIDTHFYKKELTYFIFIKWLQTEGVLAINDLDHTHDELKKLLSLKLFSELAYISPELMQKIDEQLLEQSY